MRLLPLILLWRMRQILSPLKCCRNWDAWGEARSVMAVAKTLITLGVKLGSYPPIPLFSSWQVVTKDNIANARCSILPAN